MTLKGKNSNYSQNLSELRLLKEKGICSCLIVIQEGNNCCSSVHKTAKVYCIMKGRFYTTQ